MNVAAKVRESINLEPYPGGTRLRCVAEPADAAPRGLVMLAPPFAEELNKTRRMCARQARELAAAGWRVVRMDPFGCGDSAGELRDATWSGWIDDLLTETGRQIEAVPGPLWLWGVRAGALFAHAFADRFPAANLLLWQPVQSGAQHLQQFLRLHSAAALFGSAAAAGDASPARLLASGTTVEVAGYEITPALAQGLQRARFQVPPGASRRIVWIDVATTPGLEAAPASRRALDELRAAGHDVRFLLVEGAPFWQTTEITEIEPLLQHSRALMAGAECDEAHAA